MKVWQLLVLVLVWDHIAGRGQVVVDELDELDELDEEAAAR